MCEQFDCVSPRLVPRHRPLEYPETKEWIVQPVTIETPYEIVINSIINTIMKLWKFRGLSTMNHVLARTSSLCLIQNGHFGTTSWSPLFCIYRYTVPSFTKRRVETKFLHVFSWHPSVTPSFETLLPLRIRLETFYSVTPSTTHTP